LKLTTSTRSLCHTLQAAGETISREVSKVSKGVKEAKEKHGSSACLVSLQRKRKNIYQNKERKSKMQKENEQTMSRQSCCLYLQSFC
jgi:hypothetical protein